MKPGSSSTAEWTIANWNTSRKAAVAAEASCHVSLQNNPNVNLRFFLRPMERFLNVPPYTVVTNWYSLWAEVSASQKNAAVVVTTQFQPGNFSRGN